MSALRSTLGSLWRRLGGPPGHGAAPRTGETDEAAEAVDRALHGHATGRRVYGPLEARALDEVRSGHQRQVARTLEAAESILEHRFDLLGSGPYVPLDGDRPADDGYAPIDWRLDPVSGLRFPAGFPHREWDLYAMRPGNADVKLPWELGRCQHWPVLGQAWLLSGDDRFAREVARQLDDFTAANPVGVGVQWTCTMDVAIRAANWVLGLELIRGCEAIPGSWWRRAYAALFEHGRFVRANLENTYEVTSNHYLSNVVGLYLVARTFPGAAEADAWGRFAREALETEIGVQVLEDGADFESSVPYHRLVTEMFLSGLRLAEVEGLPLSARYRERVRAMVRFLADVLRPDGRMPSVGDADDGRLHVFAGYGPVRDQDPRHLFGPAGLLFGEESWLGLGGGLAAWEAFWWGLSPSASGARAPAPPPDVERAFPDAGLALARRGGNYLLVTNGRVGTEGFGNHKHNDHLGFEYHVSGTPFLVDPGSHVYTSDFDSRNLFRSVRYHNTLRVDDVEPNEFRPEWLFRMFDETSPVRLECRSEGDAWDCVGRHRGFERLSSPVEHWRAFRFFPATGLLLVLDVLRGEGSHRLAWHFHGDPAVRFEPQEGGFALASGGAVLAMSVPRELNGGVTDAWYSPAYGVRVPCRALDFEAEGPLGGERSFFFALRPLSCAEPAASALERHRDEMRASCREAA